YSDAYIKNFLKAKNLKFKYYKHIEIKIAELLSEGKIVARFAGKMEYGPRALGNRSILCQATDKKINNWLNKRLKRTEFMPFAPSVLKEEANNCFKNLKGAEYSAEFMTITFYCTDLMRKKAPAVVHVDNTARPQIVSEKNNPSFYKILKQYRNISGIPAIINTSFNMHEEPIVCSPEDALSTFLKAGLDYLAIGSYLVRYP
ncbi:MAG: carbamoyltransferase, partial [Candidatus Woesearchaeota archaeon]|nr:carbamoyltransferase [Candidatus Woesearchaeota archaeon]